MRILILMIFVISGVFANICEANKQKIGDNILWGFVGKFYNQVDMCENLHILYPQMKANECQVVKVTQTQRNELCELFVEVFKSYGVKTSRNECKYTNTDKYVKDIKNLPSVLRKYVFNVKSLNEIVDMPTSSCVAKSSIKYNHQTIDENAVLEKIKATLKKRDDNNESYLEFVKDEDMQKKALQIYRFVGDKMLSDFFKYYNNKYLDVINNIEKSSGYWGFPIEYEVINWSATYRAKVERYKEIYDSSYITKCYKKSPQDIVTINYGKESSYGEDRTKDMTCAEVKSQMELLERAIKD